MSIVAGVSRVAVPTTERYQYSAGYDDGTNHECVAKQRRGLCQPYTITNSKLEKT